MPLGSCLVKNLKKLFNMTNFDRDEAVMKFARQLRGMGVDEALVRVEQRWRYRPDRLNLN